MMSPEGPIKNQEAVLEAIRAAQPKDPDHSYRMAAMLQPVIEITRNFISFPELIIALNELIADDKLVIVGTSVSWPDQKTKTPIFIGRLPEELISINGASFGITADGVPCTKLSESTEGNQIIIAGLVIIEDGISPAAQATIVESEPWRYPE